MSKSEVKIPESIQINVGGEPWSFDRCVRHVVDSNKKFNETGTGIRTAVRILSALDSKTEDGKVSFEDADKKELADAMEKPEHGWIPPLSIKDEEGNERPLPAIPGRAFVSYVDALNG